MLPIGGVKEKVLAAKRAGVHDVILPADNKMNVEEDLTPEQLENLSIHYVKTISEVLELALPSTPRQEKQDAEEREKVLSAVSYTHLDVYKRQVISVLITGGSSCFHWVQVVNTTGPGRTTVQLREFRTSLSSLWVSQRCRSTSR